jgi:hypothetical protein
MSIVPSRSSGFSSIEAAFALAILGLSLLGLSATTINQLRLMESVERRVQVLAPPGSQLAVSYEAGTELPMISVVEAEPTLVNRAGRWAERLTWPRLRSHDVRFRRGNESGPFTLPDDKIASIEPDPSRPWSTAPLMSRFDLIITHVDLSTGLVELTLQSR